MKIAAVVPHVVVQRLEQPFGMSQWLWDVRASCLVEVVTDDGIVGWGECFGPAAASRAIIDSVFAPMLLGRDPGERVALWEDMYNRSREWGRKGVPIAAMSGLEIALWDIAGQAAGLPVYRLLGGRADGPVEAYASAFYYGGRYDGDAVAEAEDLLAEGFRAVKMKAGAGPVAADAERVRRVRAALGPGVQLAVDANRGFSPAEAIRFGRAVADCDLWFFEEPVLPEDLAGYREVRAALDVPIAGGESEFTRWGFRDFLGQRPVDIVQPDATACGGLAETLLIAGMASAHGVTTFPHLWGSAVAIAATLHLMTALPQAVPSLSRGRPVLELDRAPNVFRDELSDLVAGPVVNVSSGPGLGIQVDRALIERYEDRSIA
ncbi:MAG TPA: mandelate racemase/muconate lactonizing enzyme family protein [Streptosporangiaceae bacterium]|nr:mandelate racemase/muconate lactonizing enzyme family protein [Streptosporangiaceae bacterium]